MSSYLSRCQTGGEVKKNLAVHGSVLLLSEDGVVGLKFILGQQLFTIRDLHVEQGIAHAEEGGGRRGHDGKEEEG